MEIFFWNNWMMLALISPVTWAFACLLNACMIENDIYKSPVDGLIITGLFFTLPLMFLIPETTTWTPVSLKSGTYAALSGICYLIHVYYYFKALFAENDVSKIEIFNLLSVLLVPVIAWFLMNESLSLPYYVAIALAGTGILTLSISHAKKLTRRAALYVLLSVVFLSFSMVFRAMALEAAPVSNVSCLFLLTGIVASVVLCAGDQHRRQRIIGMIYRFGPLFLVAESLEAIALLASQRATKLSPSVSMVAVVECALPVLIMVFSAATLITAKSLKLDAPQLCDLLVLQISDARSKCMSLMLITAAIGTLQIDLVVS